MVVFGQKLLYSCIVVLLGQSGCIREKLVVFGQKWLNLVKSGCIRVKVVAFGQSC